MARATVFSLDPAAQAKSFASQGFEYLHVVDLDGAFAGKPMNAAAVESCSRRLPCGTARRRDSRSRTVEAWLAKGVTASSSERAGARSRAGQGRCEKVSRPRSRWGSTRATARSGRGLGRDLAVTALESRSVSRMPVVAAIHLHRHRRATGLLKGLNLDATIELAERIAIPVIASGGFASIEDVKALLRRAPASWPARSRAARSMTAVSIPPRAGADPPRPRRGLGAINVQGARDSLSRRQGRARGQGRQLRRPARRRRSVEAAIAYDAPAPTSCAFSTSPRRMKIAAP